MEKEKSYLQQIDYGLVFIIFILAIISLVSVYSATGATDSLSFVKKQLMFYVLGFILIGVILLIDYRRLKELSLPLYGIGIALLIFVEFFGNITNGAQRWILIGSFKLQPSEFMKIFLVILIAHFLTKFQETMEEKSFQQDLVLTGKIAAFSILPFFLILKQPDLGTALVLICIVATMLLVGGISWRLLFLLTIMGILLLAGLVVLYFVNFDLFSKFVENHQMARIYGWLDPEAHSDLFGYQLLQALLAIGSGQLTGKGLTQGSQAQGGWIPEVHTDFIFAIIGEEFGFIGASILISVYFILIYRLVQIALTCNDVFGSYIVAGIIGMLVFQIFQNIAMTIGLMPITGLALPFISYGGSALLTNMIAIGIVLNISMRTKTYMFD
ncbi:rod shape-determining protein RodA [Caldalkalibacillus mannanilyticus]|uniref:rod shape-determining protein RodA n=1 Tax=Caldalkalibacillus mannanilyticus TaxID=1418 RepID=UPI000468B7BA|nr:rod shape-determining protein RodA [Caldalkalibacillus mannanilyticus]